VNELILNLLTLKYLIIYKQINSITLIHALSSRSIPLIIISYNIAKS